ncbi:hypothetical protein D3C78_1210090 [compost metagenome]
MQLLVSDVFDVAVIGFEDDRGLVGLGGQVTVDAVVGNVQLTIGKPLEERRIAVVQHGGERLAPGQQLACQIAPEAGVVRFGKCGLGVVGVHAGQGGLGTESVGRREAAGFFEHGFDC